LTGAQEWRAHWRVVAGSAIAYGCGFALFGLVSSLFIVPITEETGWTRGQIATASSLGLIGALSAPFIGRLADRYGMRPVAIACFVGLALVYVGLASMQAQLWLLFVGLGAFAIIGPGTGGITLTRAVNSWFDRSRGLALATTLAGVTVSALITPPPIQWLIANVSWRAGYWLLAGLCVFVAVPAVALLVHERHDRPKPAEDAPTAYPGQRWGGVWISRDFWALGGALFLMNAPAAGIVTQLSPLLTDAGLTPARAAAALSVLAVAIFVGRMSSGLLLDHLEPKLVAAIYTAAPALGCALLAFGETTWALALVAVVLIGLQQGSETDLLAFFTARQFGMRRYSSIYGALVMVGLIGTGLGVAGFGILYDRLGGYQAALIGAIGVFPVAAGLFLLLGPKGRFEED
jgi:MFS family permease